MTFIPDVQAEISVNNSTTTPLGISATFTGLPDDVTQASTVSVFAKSDEKGVTGGMEFQFSTDAVNWNTVGTHTVLAGAVCVVESTVVAQFFRILYTNGTTAQTTFELQTILSPRRNIKIIKNFSNTTDVAFGTVPDTEMIEPAGHSAALSGTEQTLWDEGGIYAFPSSAASLNISSDNTQDDGGQTGALTVTVTYLDANYYEQTETLTMNGTASVASVGSMLRINGMSVRSSGSNNANVGTIYLGTGTNTGGKPATVYSLISPDVGVARVGVYTVPGTKTAKLMSVIGSVNSLDQIVQVIFNVHFPSTTDTFWKMQFFNFNDGTKTIDLIGTQILPPTTDLILSARTVTAAVTPAVDVSLSIMTTNEI